MMSNFTAQQSWSFTETLLVYPSLPEYLRVSQKKVQTSLSCPHHGGGILPETFQQDAQATSAVHLFFLILDMYPLVCVYISVNVGNIWICPMLPFWQNPIL